MNKFRSSLLALLFLASASIANAGLLIEPHLGYIVSGKQSGYNSLDMSYSGPQYGARLGAQYLGVMGGFAYTHSSYSLESKALSGTTSTDQKQDDLGIFVGYNAPILLRVWLAHFFSSKMTQTASASGAYYKGSTTELGVGFTPLPLLSLNLSYRMTSYDKIGTSTTETTLSTNYEPKEIVLSVSLPLNL